MSWKSDLNSEAENSSLKDARTIRIHDPAGYHEFERLNFWNTMYRDCFVSDIKVKAKT